MSSSPYRISREFATGRKRQTISVNQVYSPKTWVVLQRVMKMISITNQHESRSGRTIQSAFDTGLSPLDRVWDLDECAQGGNP